MTPATVFMANDDLCQEGLKKSLSRILEPPKPTPVQAKQVDLAELKERLGASIIGLDDNKVKLRETLKTCAELLHQGAGGVILAAMESPGESEIPIHYVDDGKLSKCFEHYGQTMSQHQSGFKSVFDQFCRHTGSDRWQQSDIEQLEQQLNVSDISLINDLNGLPKDGAIVIAHDADVAAAAAHLHVQPGRFELRRHDGKTVATRHNSALALLDWMRQKEIQGVVFVRSDDGGCHALLREQEDLQALYFECQKHLIYTEMLPIFAERIERDGEKVKRDGPALIRKAIKGEIIYDSQGSFKPQIVRDDQSYIIRMLTAKQRDRVISTKAVEEKWKPGYDIPPASIINSKVTNLLREEGWKLHEAVERFPTIWVKRITSEDLQLMPTGAFMVPKAFVMSCKELEARPVVVGEYFAMPPCKSYLWTLRHDTKVTCYAPADPCDSLCLSISEDKNEVGDRGYFLANKCVIS